jgi:uncharacterized protein YqgC (DUF456 family)
LIFYYTSSHVIYYNLKNPFASFGITVLKTANLSLKNKTLPAGTNLLTMHLLSNPADLLLLIFLLAGLAGTFVPILPGPTIIMAGAVIHGLLCNFNPIGWQPITILTAGCLTAALGQTLLSSLGTHRFGGSKYGIIGGTIGLCIGFFLPVLGGIFIGTFLGALLAELYFAKKEIKQAVNAGIGSLLGLLASFFFEIIITFSMIIYIITLFY